MTEKLLEKAILDYLNILEDTFAFKINTTGIYDPVKKVFRKNMNPHIHNGTSDILGVHNGEFFAIEVKYGANKASDNQKRFLQRIKDNGGHTLVTNDLDECLDWFKTCFPDVCIRGHSIFDN